MKAFPIKSPLAGEQVVSVHPELKTFTEQDSFRRLNFFSGRSLTHTALRSEQVGRSSRLAVLGRMYSSGILQGLDVEQVILAQQSGEKQTRLHISSGMALSQNGELLSLNQNVQVDVRNLPVYAPLNVLQGSQAGDASNTGGVVARKLGATLAELVAANIALPSAMILVCQPVQVEMRLEDDDDACELDSEHYAYENWQQVDGFRLMLYAWPEEILSLPVADSRWRNRLAYSIFSYQQDLAVHQGLPWEDVGVAIAMLGFAEDWQIQFVDSHALRRRGGELKRSYGGGGNTEKNLLWQARFEQFNAHLADTLSRATSSQQFAQAEQAFRYLPPVGVLPKVFIDLKQLSQQFFPLSYHVEVSAIPYEQLDVVVQDSAGLAAYDYNRADRVQVLLPVPQHYFDPEILNTERIANEFQDTIDAFVEHRNNSLGRRLELRRKVSAVQQAISAKPIEYGLDSNAIDAFELAAPFEQALIDIGDSWKLFKGQAAFPTNWHQADFSDGGWQDAASAIGYGMPDLATDLQDMPGTYTSILLRKRFALSDLDAAKKYTLIMMSNVGFRVFLNGQQVTVSQLNQFEFNAVASAQQDGQPQHFDLQTFRSHLQVGENVLAMQIHNADIANAQFMVIPRLVETRYVTDLESDDYDTTVQRDDNDNPLLDNFEPLYHVAPMQALQQVLDGKSFLSAQEKSKLKELGVEQYISYLQNKVNRTNDKLDFGFLRVQTDIFRLRQFILGNEEASKMATSPVLSSIIKTDSSLATKDNIAKYSQLLKTPATAGNTGNVTFTATDNATTVAPLTLRTHFFVSGDVAEFSAVDRDALAETRGVGDDALTSVVKDDRVFSPVPKPVIDFSGTTFFKADSATPRDVQEQAFIVGKPVMFNHVTVGERLQQSDSEVAINSGLAAKSETLFAFKNADISVDDLHVPGFKGDDGKQVTKSFAQINDAVLDDIVNGKHDRPGQNDDEATRFNVSVKAMENTTAALRLVEGRVKSYQTLISECKKTRATLYALRQRMDKRLKVIADDLAEARHDVSVARALKNEEQMRINEINQRRQLILDEHVPFLLFRRPRLADVSVNPPLHPLYPDLTDEALVRCDVSEEEAPEEISAMLDAIREAPLNWFVIADKISKPINRPNDFKMLIKNAQQRALTRSGKHRLHAMNYSGFNQLTSGIHQTINGLYKKLSIQRQQLANIDLSLFEGFGWEETRTKTQEVISLADVIDGSHGRMGASKIAVEELEGIENMAICLYQQFATVLPAIRLLWAERLSQFDTPINLRNLYSLPRWNELVFQQRHTLQSLVDHLFLRVDTAYDDAHEMINELVRICMLLASHAPVNQLISGIVEEAVSVKPGSEISITADVSRAHIGMHIAVMANQQMVASGRVQDIVAGQLKATILQTTKPITPIAAKAMVQVGESRYLASNVYPPNIYVRT